MDAPTQHHQLRELLQDLAGLVQSSARHGLFEGALM